ncbi:MAG TPA: hypothetical protein VJS44_20835 [Pyrinomonadaceae bacterium]|nr:hypothetical protein [Pyrinomonadaceae bacterium]
MNKRFLVMALSLLALFTINVSKADAQSCPVEGYGVRVPVPVDRNLQSQIEVTYFTTEDPNALLSEKAGINRTGSYLNMNTNQFVARLSSLQNSGLASIKKRQAATNFLGELAELNLERAPSSNNARMVNASMSSNSFGYLSTLNRQTEVVVYKGSASDGEYYRVKLLSWFVDVTSKGGQKSVDFDANVLMKPGQTAVFKLRSDAEMQRTGAARSYVAITMRSVSGTSMARK